MKVQFLSPHPDDLELYCGGVLLRHHHEGDRIQIVGMTRGENGILHILRPFRREAVRRIRTRETEARVALLDGADLVWLDFPDGGMAESPESLARVTAAVSSFQPDILYLPETDPPESMRAHPDHVVTSRLARQAVEALDAPMTLRFYHTRRPNLWIDVSAHYDASRRAVRMYRNQYSVFAYPPLLLYMLEPLRRRSLVRAGSRIGCAYAEAFYEQTGP